MTVVADGGSAPRAPATLLVSAAVIGLGAAGVNTIGYLASFIQRDLALGRGLIGMASSTYFGATGFGAVAAARLVSRLGPRRSLMVGGCALASGALVVAGVGTYASLLAYAVVAGFGYAVSTVATNVAVAGVVSQRRRTLGLAAKTAGGPMLSAAFALTAGFLVPRAGWRPLFGALAVGSLIAIAVGAVTFREEPSGGVHRAISVAAPSVPRRVYAVAVGSFLLAAGSQPLFTWLLPYLVDGLGMREASAGAVTAGATASGVVGMITVALAADRLGERQRLPVLMAMSAIGALATVVVAAADRAAAVFVAAPVGIVTYAGAIGVMHAAIVDLAPRAVERASGIVLTGFYLGAWFSPFAFGAVADEAAFRTAWFGSAGALVGAACTFGGAVAVVRRRRPVGPDRSPESPREPNGPFRNSCA